ncbi:hypothetical protein GCM10008966_12580 [Rhodovulum strictum]
MGRGAVDRVSRSGPTARRRARSIGPPMPFCRRPEGGGHDRTGRNPDKLAGSGLVKQIRRGIGGLGRRGLGPAPRPARKRRTSRNCRGLKQRHPGPVAGPRRNLKDK